MNLKRKIACNYLFKQYKYAKQYLCKEIKNCHSQKDFFDMRDRVERAGIAYAQAKYCVFFKNGRYAENIISRLNIENNKVRNISEYCEFIDAMNRFISEQYRKILVK